MTDLHVSAPGKAVIAGEYVVLTGAPAVSMALNRRAHVRVEETGGSTHRVSAPGYLNDDFRFHASADAAIAWLDELPAAGSFALLEYVWQHAGITQKGGLSLTLDTTEFCDTVGGSKLGLGSSAALATALGAALTAAEPDPRSIETLAADAHREFQRGAGSGIDIATAVHGGVIGYQIGQSAVALQWPEDLAYRIFWSGEAVSTPEKLDNLAARIPLPSRDRLFALSGDVTDAWHTGKTAGLLSALRHYTAALRDFSIDHELGIFDAGHQELADMAEAGSKVVYKPCGAGGGDIGIVLASSRKDIDLFTADAVRSGFVPLDVCLDSAGVLTNER